MLLHSLPALVRLRNNDQAFVLGVWPLAEGLCYYGVRHGPQGDMLHQWAVDGKFTGTYGQPVKHLDIVQEMQK